MIDPEQVLSFRLVIPDYVPDSCLSLNGRRRTHWTVIRKAQAEAKLLTYVAIGSLKERRRFEDKVQVDIVFTYPTKRRRDPDGLAGLAKPILDALVEQGMLVDDDSEHVVLRVSAVVGPGATRTVIEIWQQA